ncbi:MAG: hypothetical protein U5K37_12120 [Natrialbaceae archaeon]|nr:hypothetical protein [Natrialbaceae archaeon]
MSVQLTRTVDPGSLAVRRDRLAVLGEPNDGAVDAVWNADSRLTPMRGAALEAERLELWCNGVRWPGSPLPR